MVAGRHMRDPRPYLRHHPGALMAEDHGPVLAHSCSPRMKW